MKKITNRLQALWIVLSYRNIIVVGESKKSFWLVGTTTGTAKEDVYLLERALELAKDELQ